MLLGVNSVSRAVKGAKINEYLLEKSRVVQQDEGERNFHIFYCMLAGICADDKEIYGLLEPEQYRYLNGTSLSDDMVNHWSKKYADVCNAMDMVGFEEQEKVDMMTILAGILSLGNIMFEPGEGDVLRVTNTSVGWLKAAAGQFGVQEEELLRSLTCTMSVTRGEAIRRLHSQQQAEDARDSIAKVAYGRVFGWIVSKVNELLAPNVDPDVELHEIGILDIFGFENFAVNRFEQLCINLANEKLQYFFNHHIFLMEQREYREEQLDLDVITYKDNKPILDLFLTKPIGILSLLDEQSAFPQATDRDFVDKLNSKFKAHPNYEVVRSHSPAFTVVHYASKVQYNGVGFLERNRDTIPASIRGLFINSVTPLLSLLFAATISRTGTLMPRKAKMAQVTEDNFNSTRKQSVGAQFKHSLGVLLEKMFAASPHFIRCIKPNRTKSPDALDNSFIMDQLRYNGLLETIRIRRDGFSWRPTFKEFAERYSLLLLKPDIPLNRESCMHILNNTRITGWTCGSSRLFFKYWHQDELARLLDTLGRSAVVIQKNFRAVMCRRRYLELVEEMRRQRQAQREEEERRRREAEEERRRQLLQEEEEERRRRLIEQENKRPVSPPVPLPRKKKPEPRPRSFLSSPQSAHLAPVPRPRSKLFEATPFDNDLGGPAHEERVKEKHKRRRNTIRWFRETQARKVVRNGEFPCWFHGMITRRRAEDLLTDKPLGCFLVRVGQSREGYTLTYRGANRCRHYMIEMQCNGKYVILGEDRAHPSLIDLVEYHTQVGIKPFTELLTVPCGQSCDQQPDYEELEFILPSPPEIPNRASDPVAMELQRLFVPPDRTSAPGALQPDKPPVLRRISDHRRRLDALVNQDEPDPKDKPVPRLYPSIRLAMREIQQIQQQFSESTDQTDVAPGNHWSPWKRTGEFCFAVVLYKLEAKVLR
ncbi:hypothetical protein ACEWY4_016520 [Coilia grayii]|uniref:Myosin-IIIb-like n=1 Tax=Coilia grayii TaxID=363190 RepID=A0ABD1JKK5_9TELE